MNHYSYDRTSGSTPTPPGSNTDNSYGRGYYPLPPQLAGLGRFADSLKPANILDHKVFPDTNEHMLTTRVNAKLSIMGMDLKALLRLGLVRIQCNDPGTLAFYFQVAAAPPSDR